MSNKHRGNKHLVVRADGNLHNKIERIAANTGADKSTIVRAAIGWMSEEQIAALVTSGYQGQAVHHGQ